MFWQDFLLGWLPKSNFSGVRANDFLFAQNTQVFLPDPFFVRQAGFSFHGIPAVQKRLQDTLPINVLSLYPPLPSSLLCFEQKFPKSRFVLAPTQPPSQETYLSIHRE
ncbi:TPA: hypothetical protein DDW69_03425 [candidate division CPR2 bacterium]|nr:MAG: hypothetical protein A2Y26_02235 [candidate division CPR2 bacterium GWD2_39_7]HBG81867.1 hypothetical protein [candidate division CPR2 bacterium]HCL99960.1 hypothetical protein [candidate division CPR2 bacterium]